MMLLALANGFLPTPYQLGWMLHSFLPGICLAQSRDEIITRGIYVDKPQWIGESHCIAIHPKNHPKTISFCNLQIKPMLRFDLVFPLPV
jgi:hypothetical protein